MTLTSRERSYTVSLAVVVLEATLCCLWAGRGVAAPPTATSLAVGQSATPTAVNELLRTPAPTPTCSCSIACRCSDADTPYGLGRDRFAPPPGQARHPLQQEQMAYSRNLMAAMDEDLFAADGVDSSCPEQSPVSTTATPLPGGSWNLLDLDVRGAWTALGWPSVPLTRTDLYVAFVDTGVDVSHPDLQGQVAPWRQNFSGPEPSTDVSGDSAHGTAMASIVAARGDNGSIGIDGIMWGAQIVPCKVGGGSNGSLARAVRCLEWLEDLIERQNLRIAAVNFSFGSECCDCAMERALARLRERGVLVIASAGNGRANSDASGACPFYPASYPLSNIVAVTGADRYGNVLFRYGKRRVHIAAPGVQIPVLTPGGGRSVMPGGSSPAAAHATGLVALLYAQKPTRSWQEVRNLLLSSGPKVSCGEQPTCALVSERRLQAWGSGGYGALSCSNQVVIRRLLPVEDEVVCQPGDTVEFRVLSIDCAWPRPLPAVAVRRASGSSATVDYLNFRDDGLIPDQVAGDGEFHAVWTVPEPPGREYRVTVGAETLRIRVVAVPNV